MFYPEFSKETLLKLLVQQEPEKVRDVLIKILVYQELRDLIKQKAKKFLKIFGVSAGSLTALGLSSHVAVYQFSDYFTVSLNEYMEANHISPLAIQSFDSDHIRVYENGSLLAAFHAAGLEAYNLGKELIWWPDAYLNTFMDVKNGREAVSYDSETVFVSFDKNERYPRFFGTEL